MPDKVVSDAADAESSGFENVALQGLTQLANDIVATRRLAERTSAETRDAVKAQLDGLESKFNKSMEDVLIRMDKLKEHSSVLGRTLKIEPGDDGLRDAISPHIKAMAPLFELHSKASDPRSAITDPVVHMAAHEWFACATKAQCRRYQGQAGDLQQRADRLYAALQERAFGSQWQAVMKAALQEDTTTEGGNLVPTIVESEVQRQIKDAGRLFPRARQFQMTKKVHQVPNESGAVTVNWIAEEGTLTGGEPTFGQKTLTALKVAGRATMSIELVEDSNVGLLQYLLTVFSEKIAGELDKQAVCGTGSAPAITGIKNTSGIIAIASNASTTRALSYAKLVASYTGLSESASIENGVWIVSPRGYAEILGLADTQGQPIVKLGTVEQSPAGTLLGRPIIVSARWAGAGLLDNATNDTTSIIYGVPSSLLFGTRMGLRWDVTDQFNWEKFQMDARLVGRYGMIVGVPVNFGKLKAIAVPAF